MTLLKFIFPLGFLVSSSVALCQQAGTVVSRTPGSAARMGITVTRVDPKPTCETTPSVAGGEVAHVPEMWFGRSWDDLVCVRHTDGRTEQIHSVPNGVPSTDGSAIAYWNSQKHELHVLLLASHSDVLVESQPNANLRGLSWSGNGRTLSYFPTGANPPGIRSFDVDSSKRNLFGGSFSGLVPSPDTEHLVAVSGEGVERFAIADGKREIVAKLQYPWSAEYSGSGKFLGILGNTSIADQNAPPAATPATANDDDGPDCTGGSSALIIQDTKTKQLTDVPFPKGFDTVLDFAFSPDENAIAATFGVVGCDYPGERAQIFLVSLADLKLTPISPEDRLSVKPVWTPDGKTVVYSDYTGSDSPLVAFEIATRKVTRLTNPGQFGPDTWIAWR